MINPDQPLAPHHQRAIEKAIDHYAADPQVIATKIRPIVACASG